MKFILNMPWTILGCLLAILSVPRAMRIFRGAVVFDIRSWWWTKAFPYLKGVRAMAYGSVVLLGPNVEPFDLEHELVHVEQYQRHPFIYPFLYFHERLKNGYRLNKFEEEAYRRAGNVYRAD